MLFVLGNVLAVLIRCLLVLGYQSLIRVFANTPSYIFKPIRVVNVLGLGLFFLAVIAKVTFIVRASWSL